MKMVHLLLLAALLLPVSCGKSPQPTPDPDPTPSAFVKGADISWVTEMEGKGYKFYNAAGQRKRNAPRHWA